MKNFVFADNIPRCSELLQIGLNGAPSVSGEALCVTLRAETVKM